MQSIPAEYAAVLEWLNGYTIEGIGFFGVQVEAPRIGDLRGLGDSGQRLVV